MMKRAFSVLCCGLILAGLFSFSRSTAADRGAFAARKAVSTSKTNAPAAAQTKSENKKTDEEKPFKDVVKDMQVIKGLFTFYRKADDGRVLMEIQPEQLEKIFLFSSSVDQAIGEKGLYAAQMGGDFPFYFHKVGKNIQWIIKNTRFTATNGTPAARATARSFPNAILGSARVQSAPHPDRKSLLISTPDLFLADLPAFAARLKEAYRPTDYHFDRGNSGITAVRSFSENALIELTLHYASDNPKTPSLTLPDTRSIPLTVKYDLSALKETGYKPRVADDRVGHFVTLHEDFSSDRPSSPFVRYIHRWQLEKADPKAALSPPKKPIVFWLENTIPVEYREWMKEGVLLWNKAFERIGFKDAIVVKQQPDNADWDAADTRYNVIRWFVGVDASFAIGPSRANPFTGQIYDADIGFSEGIIRSIRRQGDEFIRPIAPPTSEPATASVISWTRDGERYCDYADGLAQQAAFGVNVLEARGAWDAQSEEKLMHEYLLEVTAHEVGHTLGLRHNFRGSTILKVDELNDLAKTSEIGQSASVMDYNPLVIAPKGAKQGHYVPVTLGPYDYWAIEYAYKPIDGDEKTDLARIASKAADPYLPYSTDEDAMGTFSANAIDPLVNQFDQSADPVAYFRQRLEIVVELWNTMESKLLKEGEGYQVLRRALTRGLNEYYRGLLTASKHIGGVYHFRDHFGDANGRSPFSPVPAVKQREALQFLQRFAFNEEAFRLPPGLLNKLAVERLPGLDGLTGLYNAQRVDFPWHDSVLNLQKSVLSRIFQPVTLARMQDNELRFAASETPFTMADLFQGLDQSIWSELEGSGSKISSIRRNLQREYLRHLTRLVLHSSGGAPEDAGTLARASLTSLEEKIGQVLKADAIKDSTTVAHLKEVHERIGATLKAQIQAQAD